MKHVRWLPAAIVAAVVLAISRPAGVGSEREGIERAAAREPPAASTPMAARGASAEAAEPAPLGGESLRCGRDRLADIAARMPELDSLIDTLAASRNAEHLLAAAVLRLDADPERGLDLLARAWKANPVDPLIAMNRLDACLSHPGL